MNSMRLFNKEYLFQNIKKSLGPLCVTVCIMPILNFILLLFLAISGKNGYIFDLRTLSMFNYASIFILPIVLSICLFGFIFKKKSVDFINSMPISRSSIFITNTIGGILIILAMMLINVILTSIISILFPNIIMPFNLIVDYFIFWTISYIFIFTVSNIAVSLSGNAITSIVVTLLILFLIPFCHSYITQKNASHRTYIKCEDNSCIPNDYICGSNNKCTIRAQDNIYYLNNSGNETVYNYTMPYLLINSAITGNDNIIYFNINIFLKMFVLSIIYIFIGLYVFSKRKMENCETSFKNIHAHLIIKCLTLVPIIVFLYEVISIDNDLSTIIIIMFVLSLIIIYYFVYDLITKHGIKNIKLSLLYFVISIVTIYGLCGLNEGVINNNKSPYIINSSDIKNITISLGTDIKISNKEIINKILSYGLNNSNDKDKTNYMNVKYLIGKKTIEKHIFMSYSELDSLFNELNNDTNSTKKILNELKSKKYAYQIDDKYYKFDSKLDKILKSSINNIDDLKYYYKKIRENTCKIVLYGYENSNSKTTYVPCDLSSELNKYISDKKQEELYRILREEDNIRISLNAGFDSRVYDDFAYVYDMVFEDLLQFIKNNKLEDYDSSKDGCILSLYYSGEQYEYYTNKIDEIVEIIESKVELVKDTEDYKEYIDNLNTNEYDKKKDDRYE